MATNKTLVLAKHPNGFPVAGEDLVMTSTAFDPNAAVPEGGVILKTLAVSYDPYLRGKMRPAGSGYVSGFKLDEPLYNNAISRVISSSNPRFKIGDVVTGFSNFQEYVVVPKATADNEADPSGQGGLSILKNPLGLDPLLFLGALGMSGLTAYSSFYEIGKPRKGETIFVSAASGAVGQIVGQLAKREGLKVLGSVGSDDKLKFIKEELGFDGGFNYKTEKPDKGLKRVLAEIGSEGLDIYYDNVGGEQLDASIAAMNTFGRISRTPLPPQFDLLGLTRTSCMWKCLSNVQESRRDIPPRKFSPGNREEAQYSRFHRL
jgi:NADPH-dependent curcumin reductase CurA